MAQSCHLLKSRHCLMYGWRHIIYHCALTSIFPAVRWQTCPGRCAEDKACVLCRAFESGDLSQEDCEANCTHIEIVDSVEGERSYPSIKSAFCLNCFIDIFVDSNTDDASRNAVICWLSDSTRDIVPCQIKLVH